MAVHHQETISPYRPEQLFALVADVASYPEFLPWCSAARILTKNDQYMKAQLVIRFKAFRSSYTSDIALFPPTLSTPGCIKVKLLEGPFKHLTNEWEFHAMPGGGTRIVFNLDFQFESRMLEMLIGAVYEKAVKKMVGAFEERSHVLYGKPASN